MNLNARQGFTLTELIVVLAIISLLAGLLLPAVQLVRERARWLQCSSRLGQVVLAIQAYEGALGSLPPGRVGCDCSTRLPCGRGPDSTRPRSSGFTQILPFMELTTIYERLAFSTRPGSVFPETGCGFGNDANNWDDNLGGVLQQRPKLFVCPSDTAEPLLGEVATASFALVHGRYGPSFGIDEFRVKYQNTGPFGYRLAYRSQDVVDGLANTLFVGEVHDGHLPESANRWFIATRHADSLRTTDNPLNTPPGMGAVDVRYGPRQNGAFGSRHPGGANFACGDGHVEFLSDAIDLVVYRSKATRADSD